jgi:hypothetical protein
LGDVVAPTGDVTITGNNNEVNTGNVINLNPVQRTSVNSTNLSANIKISFSNRGLEYAGLKINYTSSSNQQAESTNNDQTNKNDVAVGFEIDYTRKDVPDAPKVEGRSRDGREAIRSTERGGTLKFVFDEPLNPGDSVIGLVVNKGEKTAAAKIKSSDGTEFIQTASIRS